MGETSRRGFLKAGALLGFSSLFARAEVVAAAAQTSGVHQALMVDPPPRINRGPLFERPSINAGRRSKPTGKIPILQGATSKTQSQFRILVQASANYKYRIFEGLAVLKEVFPRGRFGEPTSRALIDHVYVDGLKPGTTYVLEVETPSFKERRTFSTMASRAEIGDSLRLALISCQNDRYVNEQVDMWQAVSECEPELMLFNGDSCYVDQRSNGTIIGMWNRHIETRETLDVFKWDPLVPTITTWDDHDTGVDDSDGSNPHLVPATKYFDAMFGSDPVDGMATSGGRSFSFDTHGIRFLMLDARSNRSSHQALSAGDETWIDQQIRSSPGPVWLVNGMQFFGGYLMAAESIEKSAPAQLDRILTAAAKASVPVGLMSGDVHFSELMEIETDILGYVSYELTSSALHSRTFPGHQYRSYNRRRFESTSSNNYLALDMTAEKKTRLDFETVCRGSFDREYFRFRGTIQR